MKRIPFLVAWLLACPAGAQLNFPSVASPQPAVIEPVPMPGISAVPAPPPAAALPPQHLADLQRHRQDQQQYQQLMADLDQAFNRPAGIRYTLPSHTGEPGTEHYHKAYTVLNNMLNGRAPLSLKRAVFLVENAYLGNTLSYERYDERLQSYARFCRMKLVEEKADTGSNEARNEILFRLMSDTLTVTDPLTHRKQTHYPVHYDFEDFYGNKDWTKMFVTKLMNTNYGQCHSMPLLYAILADELGATCYLSTSPSHLFVKYRKGNEWKNAELTNGHMTTDAYLMASGYIKSEALKNRLYLDTLSRRQAIALLMQDLGKGYYVKYGFDDFVLLCANTGLRYHPNDAYGMAIKSDYNTVLFQYVVSQKPGQTPQQVLSDPQARQLYEQMQGMYTRMDNAGYAQMPEEAYEDWLQSIDKEKRKQEYERFLRYQKLTRSSVKPAHETKR